MKDSKAKKSKKFVINLGTNKVVLSEKMETFADKKRKGYTVAKNVGDEELIFSVNEEDYICEKVKVVPESIVFVPKKKKKYNLNQKERGYGHAALLFVLKLHIHKLNIGQAPLLTWISFQRLACVNREFNSLIRSIKSFVGFKKTKHAFWHPFFPEEWTSASLQEESLMERLESSYSIFIGARMIYDRHGHDSYNSIEPFTISQYAQETNLPECSLLPICINKVIKMKVPFENNSKLQYYLMLLCKNWNLKAYDELLENTKSNDTCNINDLSFTAFIYCVSMSLYLALEFEMAPKHGRKKKNFHLKFLFTLIKNMSHPTPSYDANSNYIVTTGAFVPFLLKLAQCNDLKMMKLGLEWAKTLIILSEIVWSRYTSSRKSLVVGNSDVLETLEIGLKVNRETITVVKSNSQKSLVLTSRSKLERDGLLSEKDNDDEIFTNSLLFSIALLQNPDRTLRPFGDRFDELTKILQDLKFKTKIKLDEMTTDMLQYLMIAIYSSPTKWTVEDKLALEERFSVNFTEEYQVCSAEEDTVASFMRCDGNVNVDETWRRICLFRFNKTKPEEIESEIKLCKALFVNQSCLTHLANIDSPRTMAIRDYLTWVWWTRLHQKKTTGGNLWKSWILPGCKNPIQVPDYFWLYCFKGSKEPNNQTNISFSCKSDIFHPVFGKETPVEELCLLNRLVPVFSGGTRDHRMIMDHVTMTQVWLKNLEPKYQESALKMVLKDLDNAALMGYVQKGSNLSRMSRFICLSFLRFVQETKMDNIRFDFNDFFSKKDNPFLSHPKIDEFVNYNFKTLPAIAILIFVTFELFEKAKVKEHIDMIKWKQSGDKETIAFLFTSYAPWFGKMLVSYGNEFASDEILYQFLVENPKVQTKLTEFLFGCFEQISETGKCAFKTTKLKKIAGFDQKVCAAFYGDMWRKQVESRNITPLKIYLEAFSCIREYLDYRFIKNFGWFDKTDYWCFHVFIQKADPTTSSGRSILRYISRTTTSQSQNVYIPILRKEAFQKLWKSSKLKCVADANKKHRLMAAKKKYKSKPTAQFMDADIVALFQ